MNSFLCLPSRTLVLTLAACGALILGACSSDSGGQPPGNDSGTGAGDGSVPGTDAPVTHDATVRLDGTAGDVSDEPLDCTTLNDGDPCAAGRICVSQVVASGADGGTKLQQVCVTARCGDSFKDTASGEQCDDGNDVSGDGCTLCRFDCTKAADCDDGSACNGSETCNTTTHVCSAGTAAPVGTACMIDATTAGMCRNGLCVKAGCGNGTKDAGEECDDGNANDADGCTRECKFTCASDAACNDNDACTGVETCNLTAHTCVAGKAVVCMANACAGTCNPQNGACEYPDLDKDGSTCDKDCADADPSRLPGGFECKDGKDNDCNDATADGTAPGCECYVDSDKDGFAYSTSGAIQAAGVCAAGYTRVKPVDATNTDCAAGNTSVFPGQASYFPTAYCVNKAVVALAVIGPVLCLGTWSYDYNCDGFQTSAPLDNKLAEKTCVGIGTAKDCTNRSGWIGAIPACGATGDYRQCSSNREGTCTGQDIPARARACR